MTELMRLGRHSEAASPPRHSEAAAESFQGKDGEGRGPSSPGPFSAPRGHPGGEGERRGTLAHPPSEEGWEGMGTLSYRNGRGQGEGTLRRRSHARPAHGVDFQRGTQGDGEAALETQSVGPSMVGRRWGVLSAAAGLVILSVLVTATIGTVGIPVATIFRMLVAKLPLLTIIPDWPQSWESIVFQIRLPRVILAGIVGGSLAVAGVTYQGLFRNPLADPYLIGVASGAAFGATLAFILPAEISFFGLKIVQLAAFAGALATVAAVYSLARVGGSTPMTTLLLAGVALGSLFWAASAFLMIAAEDKLRAIYVWLLGGFNLSHWSQIAAILPYVVVGLAITLLYSRQMNVIQLDEDQARQLGIDVERLKLILIAAASLMTAAAVSVSGIIGFVGLIIPHGVRLVWGPDNRFLLPMSALVGSIFLIWADTAARMVLSPGELPVGILTAVCGAPFFLYLLRQKKKAVF